MIPAKADSFLFEMGSFFVRFISPHNSIIKAIPTDVFQGILVQDDGKRSSSGGAKP